MVLIDTCGWIEIFEGGALAPIFLPHTANLSEVLVPTIVQCELYRVARRERGERSAAEAVVYLNGGAVVGFDTHLAVQAGDVAALYRLSLADSIILATAIRYRARLVTCDAHFEHVPDVEYHRK